MITFNEFEKLDIRVGTVIKSSINDKSNKPSILLLIDFGEKNWAQKNNLLNW